MHIHSKPTGPISPKTTASPLEASDNVEISGPGRAFTTRSHRTMSVALDPARASVIRGRNLNGAYDTLEIVDVVARRLLGSGDL